MTDIDSICKDLLTAARFMFGDCDLDTEEAVRIAMALAELAGMLRQQALNAK